MVIMFVDLEVDIGWCILIYMNGVFFIVVNCLLSVVGSFGNIFVCLIVLFILNLWVVLNFCIVNLVLVDLMVIMVV